MNEVMARSLSPEELAERLQDHDDPGVRALAAAIITGLVEIKDTEDEIAGLEDDLRGAESKAEEAEMELEDAKELLRECLEEISGEDAQELKDRVRAFL